MKNIKNKKSILGITGTLVFVFSIFLFGFVQASEITVDGVIELVNESRIKEGIAPLNKSEELNSVAKDKLRDMIEEKYFAHISPKGVDPWHWFFENNYDYQYAGENLAINFLSVEDQHQAWMNSPTHRKNILNSDFEEIGIAFGVGEIEGELSIITVQVFGTAFQKAESGRNFLGVQDSDLIREGDKIVPQILSLKNYLSNDLVPKNYANPKSMMPERFYFEKGNSISEENIQVIDLAMFISAFLFLILLGVVPVVFSVIAFGDVMIFHHQKKQRNFNITV